MAGKRTEKEVESEEPDWAKLTMYQTDPDQEQKEEEKNVRLIYQLMSSIEERDTLFHPILFSYIPELVHYARIHVCCRKIQ